MAGVWIYALLAAGVYCLVRSAMDLRARRWVWGILGLAAGVVILLAPIPSSVVNIDLPGSVGD